MKILASWSSGKDSAWMVHVLRQGGMAPAGLLTSINEAADRVAMHGVRRAVLEAQADAAGLPLTIVRLPSPCPNEIYEQRMAAAVADARAQGFTHVAFGDLFLEDVRRYREDRMSGTGLTPLFPLWGIPTKDLGRDMIRGGLRASITCVDTHSLAPTFAGRAYDELLLRELPDGVDPCGERGEFHTCVTAGPMFDRPIAVEPGETVDRERFVFADLVLATPRTPPPPDAG